MNRWNPDRIYEFPQWLRNDVPKIRNKPGLGGDDLAGGVGRRPAGRSDRNSRRMQHERMPDPSGVGASSSRRGDRAVRRWRQWRDRRHCPHTGIYEIHAAPGRFLCLACCRRITGPEGLADIRAAERKLLRERTETDA